MRKACNGENEKEGCDNSFPLIMLRSTATLMLMTIFVSLFVIGLMLVLVPHNYRINAHSDTKS